MNREVLESKTTFIRRILKLPPHFGLLIAAGCLVALIPLTRAYDSQITPSILVGCILSLINAFLGYMFLERTFQLSNNQFFIVSFAGLFIRFFLMLISIGVILASAKYHSGAFVFSLFAFYTVFMFVEILSINKKLDQLLALKKQARLRT